MADAFRAAGLSVIETEGWKNRGRPASVGAFNPRGPVTVHHTGTRTTIANPGPTLRVLIEGRPDLPGPLCHWTTRRDGVVVMVAAGRANHAGRIYAATPGMPDGGDGNTFALGNEVDIDGRQPLTKAQRHSIAVTTRVVLDHFGVPVEYAHRHADIAPGIKWDIGELTTAQVRTDARAVTLPTEAKTKKRPTQEDRDMTPDQIADAPITLQRGAKNTPWKTTVQGAFVELENTQDNIVAMLVQVEKLLKDAIAAGK